MIFKFLKRPYFATIFFLLYEGGCARITLANIIEEMHVCRKNYLDGSVPCGFQRTMILAKDGFVKLENGKKIGIDIICLEEDAARKIKTENKT